LSKEPYDPMVIGVATKDNSLCKEGKIFVKTSEIAYVKVDANKEKIRRGDLIVTSDTAGYGMKGINPPQGTVIGKALEDLEGGFGKIKVLLLAK
jgi:hypothetical protein